MTSGPLRDIVFRVDASVDMGTGHVMRCLTLADALAAEGAQCRFLCRPHPGHMLDFIARRGHEAIALPSTRQFSEETSLDRNGSPIAHAAWLGAHWRIDAIQTSANLQAASVDWLVVDHYAIDAQWEAELKDRYRRLMVIDDLADREHLCDVLLDQNLVEYMDTRYLGKTPENCVRLIGPLHALLRPEFELLRSISLARRKALPLDRLLIFMSGGDPNDETRKVVLGLKLSKRRWRRVDIVVGQTFPALRTLSAALEDLPYAFLHVQTLKMAQLMAAADLAVTGGGTVTWEKCALGLASLVAVMAENQRALAEMMHKQGVQRTIGCVSDLTPESYAENLDAIERNVLASMNERASLICDGTGVKSVVKTLEQQS